MTLPGISDAERLEELRDRMRYAQESVLECANCVADMQHQYDQELRKLEKARREYVAHLEMMAAGVAE